MFNKIPQVNMFNPQIQSGFTVGGLGGNNNPRTQQTSGLTPYEQDMADFRQYLPAYNGTGQLQPKNSSSLSFLA